MVLCVQGCEETHSHHEHELWTVLANGCNVSQQLQVVAGRGCHGMFSVCYFVICIMANLFKALLLIEFQHLLEKCYFIMHNFTLILTVRHHASLRWSLQYISEQFIN